MRVFDNIHKWASEHKAEVESVAGYPIDIEDVLVHIITDLKDLRKSQALTRQYYDNRLRISTHAREHYRILHEQVLNGNEVKDWDYRPKDGEYEVPEEILHSALLSVIMDDKYSFGYLYWHLASEVNRTQGLTYRDAVIPAEVINFAVDFDIDEMKKEFMSKPTPQEKKMFAVLRRADCALVLNIDNNEILSKLKENFDAAAQVLIEVAEQEMGIKEQVQNNSTPAVSNPPQVEIDPSDKQEALKDLEQAKDENEPHRMLAELDTNKLFRHESDLFYFNIWGTDYDKLREEAKAKGIESVEYKQFVEKGANTSAFVTWVTKRFRWLVCASQLDMEMTLEETGVLLRNSLKSFIKRLSKEYTHLSLDFFSDLANWARAVLRHSTEALAAAEEYYAELSRKGTLVGDDEVRVRKGASFYHYQMCKYANGLVLSAFIEISEKQKWSFQKHVFYNFWGPGFEELRDNAEKQLIKSDDEHRMINCFRNYDFFYEQFNSHAIVFAHDKVNSTSYTAHKKELKDWMHRLEVDFLDRIRNNHSPAKGELECAMESWTLCTALAVIVELSHVGEQAFDDLYETNDWSEEAVEGFSALLNVNSEVTGFIGRTLHQKREEFHQNLDRLLASAKDTTPAAPTDESPAEKPSKTEGGEDHKDKFFPQNFCTINVEVIYTFIKNQGVTDLTLDDFQYAIDYADFSKLYADAIKKHCAHYPMCIITKLKKLFDDDWYAAACKSIGKEKTRVSGYHHENGVMATIHRNFPPNLTQ